MKHKTDLELCEMYKAGNEEAFEVLWERYKKITFRIINKQRYLLKRYEKDDFLNECAIKMIRCINKYDESRKFITLYTASIENLFQTIIRQSEFHRHKTYYQSITLSDLLPYSNLDIEQDQIDIYFGSYDDEYEIEKTIENAYEDLLGCLEKGLKQIKPKYRELMYKRLVGEIKKDEVIAQMLGTTRQAVQWNRRKVENYIKENYEGEAV